jgi:hypothetical protein
MNNNDPDVNLLVDPQFKLEARQELADKLFPRLETMVKELALDDLGCRCRH